jgi:hypothetical protein
MKKIVFILILISMTLSGLAQYKENFNVSLFTGAYFAKQNVNNHGYWYGVYGEYLPFKTMDHVSFGLAFLASSSSFQNNTRTTKYQGNSKQIGFGFTGGKYWDFFTFTHSAYLGANIMLRKTVDQGEGISWDGIYHMRQEDYLISSDINFNLFKSYTNTKKYFPRTQMIIGLQKSLTSEKEDYWNGELIPQSLIWDKAGFNSLIKLSLIEIGYFENRSQIKAFLGYQYFNGDQSHWLIFGPEFSLKKWEKDDWLSLNLFVKQRVGHFQGSLNDTHFGFNLSVIINKH